MLYYKAQIYSMFVISVLFLMCWFGIKKKNKENNFFIVILLAGFINLIFDIASNYTVNHLETVNPLVNWIVHICFFDSIITLFLFVYEYLAALVEKELERPLKGKIFTYIPCIIAWISQLFLPLEYIETDSGNYSYGAGVILLYVCVAVYMGLISWHIVRFRNNISAKNRLAVVLGMVSVLVTSVFQFFNPAALTSSLGVTLFCLFMYTTVANPDAVLVELLKEERERADAANRAKSDFLAKMSHEIRTPINAVIGMNEMILRESKDTEVQKYAFDIKSSANTLLSIINEILDSSKIESGKLEIIPVNYEISSLFYDIHNMIDLKARKKGLKLIFDIDENMPSGYYGDDIRIRQILVNILTNAVKYTHEGTVTMTVRAKTDGEKASIMYSVQDTGIGIKEEDLEKLFVKFERIEETRNRNIEGTGLGINIVTQLLSLMGSELKVESIYGEGTKFWFEIEQDITNNEPLGDFYKRIRAMAEQYSYTISYIAPEAKILVVDDNEINRKVLRSLIKKTQITVFEAESGQKCLDMLKEQKFDLIFLDYMMPIMDGVETLHNIKNMRLCENTPIIMLTANAVVGAREQFLSAGFDDYLSKPINPDKLDKMVLKYLPKELVIEGEYIDEIEGEEIEENLPSLDEFDFSYAVNLLKSKEILMNTLQDFYKMLENLPTKLNVLCESIDDEENLNLYRIEVHALKSSAAMVGALLLSKVARLLEVASKDKDISKIKVLQPILLEEMEKHKERISTILPANDDKIVIENMEEVKGYFDMLYMALKDNDYDTADFVSNEIQKYLYPKEMQLIIDELIIQIINLDVEGAIESVDKVRKFEL
ncbi:MAG: response regulator [Lachnospiraceae bacterium]|nr:response regulator [Lachnospiraceae bacterium]